MATDTSDLPATLEAAAARVREILTAAGHPELAQEGTGQAWRVVSPGWHVFTYEGQVRVCWWSEDTLRSEPAVYSRDYPHLAGLRPALEAAGLAVTQPDPSVLEVVAAASDGYHDNGDQD